ncbi:low molecular weight phosphotyrosine protein phosphatase [Paenibacillus alkaliterrae]|uniref:low molecular weight protein-tyrosine-phosphatase n=1 Tax=Paenibacillus alkaliterrae TaxID=320909 RepID=UPI001F25B732|nr:low molecular weight protein-tyrosine-phosphatase [Paenibacillus alkaliterrae]MCF2938273.1 low molecular weight phosphotyrosine protein phosphatase [Paenibacillus alkaliterrae]
MKARILFVCLGNICRSPMAEAVMRYQVVQANLGDQIEVDSAGTGDWHLGHPPHEGTRKLLDEHRIPHKGMKARLVTADDFDTFDYIVCMDTNNLRDVRKLLEIGEGGKEHAARKKLFTFMELLPSKGLKDVPDPYYDGNFSFVYELVDSGCKELLQRVKADLEQVR